MDFHSRKEPIWKESRKGSFSSAVSGLSISNSHKTRKSQGKVKVTVWGNFNQKWLRDFHKAHTKEGSIHVKEKKKRGKLF